MNIVEGIHEARRALVRQGKPDAVAGYLGEAEWDELAKYALDNFGFTVHSGLELNGLKLYKVDRESHFHIV